ncbi:MAG: AtpZ/AtpI family protein [Elusimicrobiales bacterium]|nr:AtpZ/AtpI family protein [Elusimicrobiales bacterium]
MAEKENWWNYAQIGLELAGAVLLGFFGGFWLDKKLDTLPWLTLAGAVAGLAAGFYRVAKELFRVPPAEGGKK